MPDIRKELKIIKNTLDSLEKSLRFVGLLTALLADYNIKPILVGGGALEFYTYGGYITKDIDMVIQEREKVKFILEEVLGFKKEKGTRHWFNEELDLSIEFPDYNLAGDLNRIASVEIDDKEVYIISVEDLFIDRLNACKHWKSVRDCEWAARLLYLYKNDIDMDYIRKRAREELSDDKLAELEKRVSDY